SYPAVGVEKHRVALFDFGYKRNLRESLRARGCQVTVVPAQTSLAQLRELKVDGVLLSNGPGDPEENGEIILNLRKIATSGLPMMGVGLG
ncbi:MAG: carbamoyl phosphate synthase small subunit, partial [Oscillospiraceae bacterium]